MQETRVQSLVQKIPHAAEQLSPGTTTIEPVLTAWDPQPLSPRAAVTEAWDP